MKHLIAYVLALAAILILGCTLASAQGTAQISGTIADINGNGTFGRITTAPSARNFVLNTRITF